MSKLATQTDALDERDGGCRGCQHRVDVPGVDQIVCLAHLAVFSAASRDGCEEFEAKTKPSAATGNSAAR